MALQQSHFPNGPDMRTKEKVVKSNGTQKSNISQVMNTKNTLNNGLTNVQEELSSHPQTVPLIIEMQTHSPEVNVANSFSTPGSQSIRTSPFQACLSQESPTSSPGSYVSANNSGVAPSAGRVFSLSNPSVNPSPGESVSPGSLGVSPSPGRNVSPVSPDVTTSFGRHVPPTSPDVTPSSGRDFSPSSPDIIPSSGRYPLPNDATPSSGRYLSPSSSGVTASPRRDESSHSEAETNASDSGSFDSFSPQRPLRQHCKFCRGQSPTRGHVSESSLSEGTSSLSSRPSSSSCAFCCEDVKSCSKTDTSGTMANQKLQQGNIPLIKTFPLKDGLCGKPPNRVSGMGLCSFDSNGNYGSEAQYPSRCGQQREASTPNYLPQQEQITNQTGVGGSVLVGAEVQDSQRSATTTALSSSQWHPPRDQSAFAQGSVSPLQAQTHVVHGSHVTKKENTELAPAKLSPVARHHQQDLSLTNEKDGNITGPLTSKPLLSKSTMVSPSAVLAASHGVSVAPSASGEIRPLMQKPLSSPSTPKPLLSFPAVRTSSPGLPQSLLSNSPNWPGQQQHIPPLMANLFQQPGFPRHQFGNAPFVPPGVFNPAVFQGWDMNALMQQQQLLASRLPFGPPFQPMQNPVQRFQPPAGRRGIGPAGRRRSMAPKFYNPGVVNIKTSGNMDKINTGRCSTPPGQTSSVHNTLETQKHTVGKNRSTTSDAMTSNVSRSPAKSSADNTDIESGSRELSKVESTSVSSCAQTDMKLSLSPSSASDLSPTSLVDTMPKESREETGCQGFLPSPGPGKDETVSEERKVHTLSPTSSLSKQGDLESAGTKKISPSKMSPSELLLKEQKVNV